MPTPTGQGQTQQGATPGGNSGTTGGANRGSSNPAAGNQSNSGGNSGRNGPNNNNRSGNRQGRGSGSNRNNSSSDSRPSVKGATKELNNAGCIFSLPGESQSSKQWKGMMDSLSLYASTHHSAVNRYLDALFDETNPKLPRVAFPRPFRPTMPDHPREDALEEVIEAHEEDIALLNKMAQKMRDEQVKEVKADQTKLANALRTLFCVIVGQCTESVQGHLANKSKFASKQTDGDCHWLLQRLRQIVTDIEESQF